MALIQELEHLKIPLEDIKLATNNFSDDNFIGQGRFERVYKGQLPISASNSRSVKPGSTVAVKRLDLKGGQGELELLLEIFRLSSYRHRNLLSLIGFSEEGAEKIIVYEHENVRGSLDKYLATTDLTWMQRLQICLGAARGINYLHSGVGEGHMVVHRDIKSSNVLLDEDWEAKICDFGLANASAGTFGYVDPSYLMTGVLTKESDVYSFGVVLFEVLCGRLAMEGRYNDERRFLSGLAKLRYEEGKVDEIIIPCLRRQMDPNSLKTFSAIAYQCLQEGRKHRPTMGLIIEQLQISLELQTGCLRMTELWGSSTGGSPWWFQLDNGKKLRKIKIDHEDWIYSLGFTTEDINGFLDSSQLHGGIGGLSGGKISEITFDVDEEITGIYGTVGVTTGKYSGYRVISSLCITTTKKMDGPFGQETGTPFSVSWDVGSFAGFYGRAGFYIDGLGCYLKSTT